MTGGEQGAEMGRCMEARAGRDVEGVGVGERVGQRACAVCVCKCGWTDCPERETTKAVVPPPHPLVPSTALMLPASESPALNPPPVATEPAPHHALHGWHVHHLAVVPGKDECTGRLRVADGTGKQHTPCLEPEPALHAHPAPLSQASLRAPHLNQLPNASTSEGNPVSLKILQRGRLRERGCSGGHTCVWRCRGEQQ